MVLTNQEISAVARRVQALDSTAAVALKLPTFWTSDPDIWFSQVEAQFAIRGITGDTTQFHYIITALDSTAAKEVRALIVTPPAAGKYQAIKTALIKAFGKTQAAKDAELLSISGLGDRTPSALLRHMDSLNSDPATIRRALFLAQMPADVRRILASSTAATLPALAEEADKIVEATRLDMTASGAVVSAIRGRPQQQTRSLCRNHTKFGADCWNCPSNQCPMHHLVRPRPSAPAASTNSTRAAQATVSENSLADR